MGCFIRDRCAAASFGREILSSVTAYAKQRREIPFRLSPTSSPTSLAEDALRNGNSGFHPPASLVTLQSVHISAYSSAPKSLQ